ncbi:MAG TPA: prepilin-type N-terminal cleavage/methylation domain-containing protein [Candidatus Saccharimonadales bacterium]|nr:prepilin-type N-terminal cleavage/methylation domain-containing protein [Candidatus Saccharimonadales bacterium]
MRQARHWRLSSKARQDQRGFTIVELLIATMVFSVVLLLVTAGILQVSRVYYRGVTETNTQNVARSVLDSVSQAIQFSGGPITVTTPSAPGAQAFFCVGAQQFVYYLGYELVDGTAGANQTNHSLVQQSFSGSCSAPASLTGRDLLSPKMRLSDLTVSKIGTDLYQVHVRIVYGDDAILMNPTTTTAACQTQLAGTQFCAVSDLTTVVTKRVQ